MHYRWYATSDAAHIVVLGNGRHRTGERVVKCNANDWSDPMQLAGQVECKWVVRYGAISQVSLDNGLKLALKSTAAAFKAALTETLEYGLLAENNQSSALTIPQDETHAAKFVAESHDQTPAKRISEMEELANAEFYVVKFSSAQGNLYCVRKTDSTWKTKKRAGAIHTFFKSKTLKLDEAPSFHIAKDFDMAVLGAAFFKVLVASAI